MKSGARYTERRSVSILSFGLALAGCTSRAESEREVVAGVQQEVIYGNDDRVEYLGITDDRLRLYANATAALVWPERVNCSGATCTLTASAYAFGKLADGTTPPLCPGVRFKDQQTSAFCTAFLVGPQTIMTAGHCMGASSGPSCDDKKVVFGFYADSSGNSVLNIPSSDVYSCVGTPEGVFDGFSDWTIFNVDRPVTGRIPLMLNYAQGLPHTEHVVFGNMAGLPQKMKRHAEVKYDNPLDVRMFGTTADTFPGDSGSPTIELDSGIVTGITSAAEPHYIANGSCAVEAVCPEDGTSPCDGFVGHMRVSYVTQQTRSIPLHAALLAAVN